MVSSTNPGPGSAATPNTEPASILSGSYLYANLPAATTVAVGTIAYTTDQGTFISNGASWTTSPGIAVPNANNGGTETIVPQNKTGLNVNAANWIMDTASNSGFAATGALYNDPVICFGYNVAAVGTNGSLASSTPDPFSSGFFIEADYNYNNAQSFDHGTSTAGSATTLTDTGQAWGVNQWAQWVLYNSTTGGRGLITSNTATVITVSGGMLQIDGLNTAPANANAHAYQILGRVGEDYTQVGRITPTGSLYQRIRPYFLIWDKATSLAQGNLASGGALTIVSATAANPPVFTTSVSHGMQAGSPNGYTAYVKFLNLAGGTWGTNLNTNQYIATVTGATTFTIAVNATGFGTYTASSGTATVEGAVFSVTEIIGAQQGMNWALPSWNGSPNDYVASQADGVFTVFGRPGSNNNAGAIVIKTDPLGVTSSIFQGTYKGVPTFSLYGGFSGQQSTAVFQTFNSVGANPLTTLRLSQKDSATAVGNVGKDVSDNGVWNISNFGQTTSTVMQYMRIASGQTGDILQAWDSTGNTTKLFAVNASGAIGVNSTAPPAKVTGFGSPTGTGVIANFPGATATLAQCSQAIAQLITDMKGIGFYGT